jgi:hypothetical protein
MSKTTNVSFGISVALSEAEASKIAQSVPGDAPVADKIGAVGGGLLRDLAKGGVMIPREWADRIDAAIDTLEPSRIVESVEKSVNKVGESTSVQWVVDPTQITYYQHLADNAGISLERQLKSVMDFAYEQGWFGMNTPDANKIFLSAEEYRRLQELFGKDVVTGADVISRLQGEFAPPAESEEDPIMASLRE